jgi:serine/threonine protein kinase
MSQRTHYSVIKKVRSEIELLSGLPHHDNVVPLLRYEDDGASISLIMPWMSGGTLTSFIDTHGKVLETAAKSTLVSYFQSQELYSEIFLSGA